MPEKVAEKYRSKGYPVTMAAGPGVVPRPIDHLRDQLDLIAQKGQEYVAIEVRFASVEMGQTVCSNSYNLERGFPMSKKLGIASASRRRSPSFGSISSNTPPFRTCVTSTGSTPRCSTGGRRGSSGTPAFVTAFVTREGEKRLRPVPVFGPSPGCPRWLFWRAVRPSAARPRRRPL